MRSTGGELLLQIPTIRLMISTCLVGPAAPLVSGGTMLGSKIPWKLWWTSGGDPLLRAGADDCTKEEVWLPWSPRFATTRGAITAARWGSWEIGMKCSTTLAWAWAVFTPSTKVIAKANPTRVRHGNSRHTRIVFFRAYPRSAFLTRRT